MPHRRSVMAGLACLFCASAFGLFWGSAAAKQQQATRAGTAKAAEKAARIRVKRTNLRKGIKFYRQSTWKWQDAAMVRHTPTSYAERTVKGLGFLHWSLKSWQHRSAAARHYVRANPWLTMLRRTSAYRSCIIGHESRHSGLYKAENGGTRYVESAVNSNASGAYQFLDSTWSSRFLAAKQYFHGRLKGSWTHAADAPAKVQDIVAAYAIMADNAVDWTWSDCRSVGLQAA